MKNRVEKNRGEGKPTPISVMLDEIHIRAHTEYAKGKYHGYVDVGAGRKDDDKEAKEALVFMAVSINETWKIPLGYFLIDGLSGEEKANLVNECF